MSISFRSAAAHELSVLGCPKGEARAAGNLAFGAQIVALCRESGVRALVTEDRDFRRFPEFALEHLS